MYVTYSTHLLIKRGVTYHQTIEEVQATMSKAAAKCQQKHMVTNITLSCRVKSHSGPLSG